ncbi:MAG: VOC family protein [Planctomycetes bacterium]|nr:VOC family protein [Planctomycetota bacterium]
MSTNLGNRVLPCLFVADMRETLDFYIDVLGFTQTGYYPIESEPIRTEVRRDDVAIILFSEGKHIDVQAPVFSGVLYIFPESVDRLAEELNGKVEFAWGPEDTESGIREFAIRDPNGYTLVFAEPTGHDKIALR